MPPSDRTDLHHLTSPDGTSIGYRESGSGPPLLMVHGTTADHRRWDAIAPRFEDRFTVLAMDRRGRGMSEDGPEYAVAREAEDVAAVVDAAAGAAGEAVDVVAHSYGAVCSLEAALLTDRIRRLVLYEPPIPTGVAMYPPGVPDRMQSLLDAGEPETALETFFRETVRMPDHEFDAYRRLPMWQVRISLAHTIPREMVLDRHYRFEPDRFADLQVPTLLLLGGDSPPLFQQAIDVLRGAIPDVEVAVLPGQQHVAMDTAPELLAGEVLGFLLDRE